MDLHPEGFDLRHQHLRAFVVDLARHQAWSEFDDVRLQAEIERGLGRLQPEQAAANDRAAFRVLRVGDHVFEIFDRPIDEDSRVLDPRHLRHERERAGGHDNGVVDNLDLLVGADDFSFAVDFAGTVADVQFDAVFVIPLLAGEHQLFGVAMGKKRRESDAVVSGARLLAERDEAILAGNVVLDEFLAKAMTHHSVTDDDDGFAGTRGNHDGCLCSIQNFATSTRSVSEGIIPQSLAHAAGWCERNNSFSSPKAIPLPRGTRLNRHDEEFGFPNTRTAKLPQKSRGLERSAAS